MNSLLTALSVEYSVVAGDDYDGHMRAMTYFSSDNLTDVSAIFH